MNQLLTEIENCKNKFQAGKSTLEKEEITQLQKDTINNLNKIVNQKFAGNTNALVSKTEELLGYIIEGEFSKDFINNYEIEQFYSFGKILSELYSRLNKENTLRLNKLVYHYLNLFKSSELLKKIKNDKKWTDLILELILNSNFNTKKLFEQRTKQYQNKTLFKILRGKTQTDYTWSEANKKVKEYAAALLNLTGTRSTKPKVAFLMNNSLEMALLDIACLNYGIINVMIPANSVPQHINFIVNQTEVEYILISDEKQLAKVKSIKANLKKIKKCVLIDGISAEDWVISFSDFLKQGKNRIVEKEEPQEINSMATLMYTSGTTGEPKGIIFSQKNIVFKRFCRAIALPEINETDVFLSYLPLFHTFGRWFELMGSIFWAATYTFMENPSAETMMMNMQSVKPTIFISIPKKWMQLYDYICAKVDIEEDDENIIAKEVKKITGGKLKWGLSAAGYLPPEVFLFFQKYGIQLMSGFGMTEATGGITMTPPNNYKPNSLGKALPGIEIKLAEDGELLVRGNYVMKGYFGQHEENSFVEGDWFPTGDIMKMDNNNFIEIIDRKKEIYKNIKGETIAPQKIENLFRDFELIKQVFVVGDHRPFNTVLIFPDTENEVFTKMFDDQKAEYFSNIIVTVNQFLAPFERIVDFRVIDRPFTQERGELTPKGTYKRRIIEKNFEHLIKQLYQKDYYSLYMGKTEIKIPNWFLREKGCLSTDVKIENNKIVLPKLEKHLIVEKVGNRNYRIGDFIFHISKPEIQLHEFLINPIYWLGNEGLVSFTDETILQWYRQSKEEKSIKFISKISVDRNLKLTESLFDKIAGAGEKSLFGLHLAIVMLQAYDAVKAEKGIDYISKLLTDESQQIYKIAFYFLDKPKIASNIEVQKKLFLLLLKKIKPNKFKYYFKNYLTLGPNLFDENIKNQIVTTRKENEVIEVITEIINSQIEEHKEDRKLENTVIPILLDILSLYGIKYPTKYENIRRRLVEIQLKKDWQNLSETALNARKKMREGFRKWLGESETVAVDIETEEEYEWSDVIIFEEDIDDNTKQLLENVISKTAIVREAIFLFYKGVTLRLSNILPGGVWISKHLENSMFTIFRISIQSRHEGSFDILLRLNKTNDKEKILEEINWLILSGSQHYLNELVENFGGYWNEYNLWSQKYIPGVTIANIFRRQTKKNNKELQERLFYLWPFFIWNATAAYIHFWEITSRKYQLKNPSATNIVAPSHDYQTGTRFEVLGEREKTNSISHLLFTFYNKFVLPIEEKYSFVKNKKTWDYIFSGINNAEGENKGKEILKSFLSEIENQPDKREITLRLKAFLNNIDNHGYIPKQLYFAIKRFLRWYNLNKDASIDAQAEMLNGLYETYNLDELEKFYPETRSRFYLETVFKNSDINLKNTLRNICKYQHEEDANKMSFLKQIAQMQKELPLSEKESFFLTRLSYPHLKPTDTASFLDLEVAGEHTANLVIQVEDYEGNPFYLRKPITPKEISKLHQLFIEANLKVSFKTEHQFLVAVSERGFIIGGLYYYNFSDDIVQMEKIVVSNRYRRKGVSEALMNEFFHRAKDEGYNYVTTGFYRPEYFYRFGFKIEKKYSGLVKKLDKKQVKNL